MPKGKNLWNRLSDSMEIPGETLPGQCVLELLGENRVLIEGHRGVTQYSQEKIGVRLRFGTVCICGCGLELRHMTQGQLVIQGRIEAITLHRRG